MRSGYPSDALIFVGIPGCKIEIDHVEFAMSLVCRHYEIISCLGILAALHVSVTVIRIISFLRAEEISRADLVK